MGHFLFMMVLFAIVVFGFPIAVQVARPDLDPVEDEDDEDGCPCCGAPYGSEEATPAEAGPTKGVGTDGSERFL